jgi:uracil-DNA glycosylase family protein
MAELPAYDATPFLPRRNAGLVGLANAAAGCRGCPLWEDASQTVFGEGPSDAPLMLVGEQPGDREDIEGRPFVGPAGRELAQALSAAGLEREDAYVTNAVKHFKFKRRGKRRIHDKPSRAEVGACSPWLGRELDVVGPDVLVLLGATAAQSLLGPEFRVTRNRGIVEAGELAATVVATIHPSAILRGPADQRAETRASLVEDLRLAAGALAS